MFILSRVWTCSWRHWQPKDFSKLMFVECKYLLIYFLCFLVFPKKGNKFIVQCWYKPLRTNSSLYNFLVIAKHGLKLLNWGVKNWYFQKSDTKEREGKSLLSVVIFHLVYLLSRQLLINVWTWVPTVLILTVNYLLISFVLLVLSLF